MSRKTTKVVDDVQIFRLNIQDLSWEKMVRLKERTCFWWTNRYMSVSRRKTGCRKIVYFSHNKHEGRWEFDMEKSSIDHLLGRMLQQSLV
ncbi:hypothetical protein SLA2020_406450 [Shorea laevis]